MTKLEKGHSLIPGRNKRKSTPPQRLRQFKERNADYESSFPSCFSPMHPPPSLVHAWRTRFSHRPRKRANGQHLDITTELAWILLVHRGGGGGVINLYVHISLPTGGGIGSRQTPLPHRHSTSPSTSTHTLTRFGGRGEKNPRSSRP